MPNTEPELKARLAHRALRLEEHGIRTRSDAEAVAAQPSAPPGVIGGEGHPLAGVARSLLADARDDSYVDRLLKMGIVELRDEWDRQRREHQQATLKPSEIKRLEKVQEQALASTKEEDEAMRESGDWPREAPLGAPHGALPNWIAANALYDKARAAFLGGDLDWDSDIRAILVDSADYTVDLANHEFLSSIAAGAREEVSGAFAGKTKTAGVADANDVVLTAAAGDVCEAVVIYQHTGSDATARLIAYIDTATGLPITLNGGDVTLQWDSGANRIFKL